MRNRAVRVLLLSRYGRQGASSRVRSYQYIPYLNERGIEIVVEALLTDGYLKAAYGRKLVGRHVHAMTGLIERTRVLLKTSRYDLLWIEKELLPWIPWWLERRVLPKSVPYIVDYDDAIFHRYDQHRNALVRRVLGHKIDSIMRNARAVIVGSRYLGSRARSAGARRIEFLPSVVDLDRYQVAERTDARFTIGWIGSPSTIQYLRTIREALRRICEVETTRMVIVGGDHVQLDGVPLEKCPWSEESETRILQQFDVGIMPLPDGPWERGKCGYKLIQYMAAGIPVVASPVGANVDIVQHGQNGFLASTPSEWEVALSYLRSHPDERRAMGTCGRKLVEREFSLAVTAPRLHRILRAAIGV